MLLSRVNGGRGWATVWVMVVVDDEHEVSGLSVQHCLFYPSLLFLVAAPPPSSPVVSHISWVIIKTAASDTTTILSVSPSIPLALLSITAME